MGAGVSRRANEGRIVVGCAPCNTGLGMLGSTAFEVGADASRRANVGRIVVGCTPCAEGWRTLYSTPSCVEENAVAPALNSGRIVVGCSVFVLGGWGT